MAGPCVENFQLESLSRPSPMLVSNICGGLISDYAVNSLDLHTLKEKDLGIQHVPTMLLLS